MADDRDLASRLADAFPQANEFGTDPFGYSLDFALQVARPLHWLYRHYFRVACHGIERVPEGRVLLVANHSGQVPLDAAMIAIALLVEGPRPRLVRGMTEKWIPTLPFGSTFMSRTGMVVGTPENCRRLLNAGEPVLVFPEGFNGIVKSWSKRYQLQDFGLGFVRLALETDTPIVPVAVIGAEEQLPALAEVKPLARLLGIPSFPLVASPLPLPTKYRLHFGTPRRLKGEGDEDADLELQAKLVKAELQGLIQSGLRERKHVFW